MAVLKWVLAMVLMLIGFGALGWSVLTSTERAAGPLRRLPEVSLSDFTGATTAPPAPAADQPPEVIDAGASDAPPKSDQAEGVLNLRATDTADVFVDGAAAGGAPVLGFKVKVGAHRVRFDCFDEAGNATPGAVRTLTVHAEQEVDFEHTCP